MILICYYSEADVVPREGVPYPERLLCSLRCELKNIWTALNGKLHSVNGVEGDGQGNVNIVSGDAAVVVTTDPSLNQIEVSLDQSQLPAAAVTSVNGQTGTVRLIGADIKTGVYSSGNSATQDISTARASISGVNQNVATEATARLNADNALQTNINAVQASIPGAAAAAVAADPTVASLVSADSQNVKLSGNQSIGGIKTVSTQITGQYNTQIANSQKVKNELDNYTPMVRTSDNQTIAGIKTFTSAPVALVPYHASFIHQCSNYTHDSQTPTTVRMIQVNDNTGNYIGRLNLQVTSAGNLQLRLEGYIIDSGGNRTVKSITIAELTP